MNNKINTYEDLLQQEEQLEALLAAQRELLVYDFQQLKADLQPARQALSLVSKITTKERGSFLLNEVADKLIDLIVKKIILGRAGWLTRLTVPFFIKNYSSHIIADHKEKWFDKLFSWFTHKNGNGHSVPQTHEEDAEEEKE